MNLAKTSLLVSLALAASAANADIQILASIDGGSLKELTSVSGNTVANYSGSLGGFNINNLFVTGQNEFGGSGELLDISSLDVATSGKGHSLMLEFVENGISSSNTSSYTSVFSAAINNAKVSRSFSANGGTAIGSTTGANSTVMATVSGGVSSLEEIVTITATGPGAKLSSDDSVTANVPAPAVVSLLGLGLSVIGFARRRK